MEKVEIPAYEVQRKILTGECFYYREAIIDDSVCLPLANVKRYLNFSRTTIKGNISFNRAIFNDSLDLTEAVVEGHIDLSRAIIKGNIFLSRAIIKGYLDLFETIVVGKLLFATKEGPEMIYVDSKMVKLVHFAAPTVPLVVRKRLI